MEGPLGGVRRMCGGIPIGDRDEDDPSHILVVHRDVGGDALRNRHRMHDRDCWCHPLLMVNEDTRRGVYQDQLAGLGRLN